MFQGMGFFDFFFGGVEIMVPSWQFKKLFSLIGPQTKTAATRSSQRKKTQGRHTSGPSGSFLVAGQAHAPRRNSLVMWACGAIEVRASVDGVMLNTYMCTARTRWIGLTPLKWRLTKSKQRLRCSGCLFQIDEVQESTWIRRRKLSKGPAQQGFLWRTQRQLSKRSEAADKSTGRRTGVAKIGWKTCLKVWMRTSLATTIGLEFI